MNKFFIVVAKMEKNNVEFVYFEQAIVIFESAIYSKYFSIVISNHSNQLFLTQIFFYIEVIFAHAIIKFYNNEQFVAYFYA